jgi:hypothetical protein
MYNIPPRLVESAPASNSLEVFVQDGESSAELLFLFALSLALLDWYRGYSEAEDAVPTKKPAAAFYDPQVLSYANIIYVVAHQMGISTHALAGFMQLHLEEIEKIVNTAEIVEVGNFVKEYQEQHPDSAHQVPEAITYYVWQRMGATHLNLGTVEWNALWQQIYRFFTLLEDIDEVIPPLMLEEAFHLERIRAEEERIASLPKLPPMPKWATGGF